MSGLAPDGAVTGAQLSATAAALADKVVSLEPGVTTILRDVRLIDGTGAPPRDGVTITIEGSRIASIEAAASGGPAGPPPAGTVREIDGAGRTVIPGLIDLHVHFTGDTGQSPAERYAINVWEAYRDIRAVWHVAQTLEAGFTTVRVLGHGRPELHNGLRRAITEGLIPGPRLLTAGWAISQTGGHGDPKFMPHELTIRHRPRSAFADGPVACRTLVRQNFGEGADLVKIYVTEGGVRGRIPPLLNFTQDEIRAMTDEAHGRGARVAAHAMSAAGIRHALAGGVDTIEHGGAEAWETPDVVEAMIEHGAWLVPTLTVYELYCGGGAFSDLHAENTKMVCDWLASAKEHLYRAKAQGLQIATGTDSLRWAGNNARELPLLVECGFSPMEAIEAATRVSAEALGLADRIGTLEPGKLGELLVLGSDPLADIRTITDKSNIRLIFTSREQLKSY